MIISHKQLPLSMNGLLEKHSKAIFAASAILFVFTITSGLLVTVSLFVTEFLVIPSYLGMILEGVLNNMLWLFIPALLGFLGMMTSLKRFLNAYAMPAVPPIAPSDEQSDEMIRAIALDRLAQTYHTQGDYRNAAPLYEKSLRIVERVLGKQHPDYATSLNNLALLHYSQGEYDKALALYEQALQIYEQGGKQHPYYATSLNNLAGLYQSQGAYDKALPLYEQALQIRKQALGQQHPDYATSLNNLAGLYQSQGAYDKALPLYEQAAEISVKVLGDKHPNTVSYQENYERCRVAAVL
jgi:tetratricopeptide (TPR) repeat protein